MSGNRISTWVHRRLMRFYPAEFREEFGAEMEQDFRAQLRRERRASFAGLWLRTLTDWLISVPREQLDVTGRDLRSSLRALRRSPLFTMVVVLSLAVGIAGASLVFTIANTLLIQTPLDDPSQFVGVLRGDGSAEPSSWPDYVDYRDRNHSFTQFAAWNILPVFLGRGERSRSVMAETVTDNYFALLRLEPFRGRLFSPGECPTTCGQEVILSYRFWQHDYGGDPAVVGREVPLGGVPATIIGITPKGFDGTLSPVMTDIWIHVENRRLTNPELFADRNNRWLAIAGRLKDGVSRSQAVADLNTIDAQLQIENRYTDGQDRRLWAGVTRGIGIPVIRRKIEFIVTLLGAAALLILLISCANVANMVLSRATARRQETAMRRALGAGSSRLIRLSLTESLMLAILGGIAGLLLSMWVAQLLPGLQPPANDLYTYRIAIHQDYRVWAFTLIVSLGCGLLFGALPALQTARTECLQAIRNLTAQGRPRFFARRALVSIQVAFSVILLVVAGLFCRSLVSQQGIAPGFPVHDALIVPLNLNLASYAGDREKGRRFFESVKDRVRPLPGVESASLSSYVPLNSPAYGIEVRRESTDPTWATLGLIDPDYLSTMNLSLAGGRNFSSQDREGSQPVALVDEQLAQRLWPDSTSRLDALGRTLRIGEERSPVLIVGVVSGDFRSSLAETPRPVLFLPSAQRYSPMLYLVVRTDSSPEAWITPTRRIVESVDDAVSLRRVRTLEAQLDDTLWPIRTGSQVVVSASMLAVLLALVGLYGVIACAMAGRRREVGIRVALGARTADVLGLVLREGLAMTAWGVLFGVPLAVVANVGLTSVLFGIRPVDPMVASAAVILWVAVSCGACIPPTWQTLRNATTAIRELG